MKATVTAGALSSAAGWVARIVPGRPTVPVLGGVLIEATSDVDRDEVSLSAFDYDTAGVARLADGVLTVDEPGRVLVSGRLLAAVAKTLGSGETPIVLEVGSDGRCAIVAGRSRWDMPTLAIDDYPAMPVDVDAVGRVDAAAFVAATERVLDVPNDHQGTIKALGGVAIEGVADGPLTLVATDRWRLAVAEVDWTPAPGLEQVLVPAPAVRLAAGAVAGTSGEVELLASAGTFGVRTAERTLSTRLLAESYPRWRNLDMTPDKKGHSFVASSTVAVADLRAAMTRASVMLPDAGTLDLRFTADGVEITAGGDDGQAEHVADVAAHDGEEVVQRLNAQYLREAIDGAGSEHVRLDLPSAAKAVLLRPCQPDGTPLPAYRHTVMAVRRTDAASVAA
ncbi:DNA polymerase III subunit beta [Actinomycetospora aeridis]|uniref:DNA polymerase III subunit beta n=1 Tax=Actinomycetospora aeridis TaxID=3129231 RepID=A0ABU8N381_9PSEU